MRSASAAVLIVPRMRSAIGDRSFSIAVPRVGNSLLPTVRDTNSPLRFRKLTKAFLFSSDSHGDGDVELTPLNELTKVQTPLRYSARDLVRKLVCDLPASWIA